MDSAATGRRDRQYIHVPAGLSDRATDAVARVAGSWGFLWFHVGWCIIWWLLRLDANLFTLLLSLESIFLAIALLMNQNRQTAKDRLRDDHEAEEVGTLYAIVQELRAMDRQQLDVLAGQDAILAELRAARTARRRASPQQAPATSPQQA